MTPFFKDCLEKIWESPLPSSCSPPPVDLYSKFDFWLFLKGFLDALVQKEFYPIKMGVNPQTPGIYRIEDQSMKKSKKR